MQHVHMMGYSTAQLFCDVVLCCDASDAMRCDVRWVLLGCIVSFLWSPQQLCTVGSLAYRSSERASELLECGAVSALLPLLHHSAFTVVEAAVRTLKILFAVRKKMPYHFSTPSPFPSLWLVCAHKKHHRLFFFFLIGIREKTTQFSCVFLSTL